MCYNVDNERGGINMEGNLENVKKYMKMIGEITQNGEYRDFEIAYLITEAGGYIDKDENNITEKDVKKVNILMICLNHSN